MRSAQTELTRFRADISTGNSAAHFPSHALQCVVAYEACEVGRSVRRIGGFDGGIFGVFPVASPGGNRGFCNLGCAPREEVHGPANAPTTCEDAERGAPVKSVSKRALRSVPITKAGEAAAALAFDQS